MSAITNAAETEAGPSLRLTVTAAAVALAAFLAAAIVKGPSLDEFWTLFYTDPKVELAWAWEWWSGDTGHPVGYYLLLRLLHAFVPETVLAGRLLNLIPLAILLAAALRAARSPRLGTFPTLFVITLLGNYAVLERFAETRASFWGLMLVGALVLVLSLALAGGHIRGRLHAAIVGACVALALTDYMALAAANALIASFGIVAFVQQRKSDLWKVASALAAGWIVAGLSLWNAFGYPLVPAPYHVDLKQFAINIAMTAGSAILGNVVVTALAVWTVVRLSRDPSSSRERWWLIHDGIPLCLGLTTVLAALGFAVLNELTHVLVKRQLLGLAVLACGFVSALAAASPIGAWSRRLIVPCMAITLAAGMIVLWHTPNLQRHAPALAEAQRRCPGFRIFATDYDDLDRKWRSLNQLHAAAALDRGYKGIARDFGLRLSNIDAGRAVDGKCGGALWFEQVWLPGPPPLPALLDRMGLTLSPDQLARTRVQWQAGSLLVMIPGQKRHAGAAVPPQ